MIRDGEYYFQSQLSLSTNLFCSIYAGAEPLRKEVTRQIIRPVQSRRFSHDPGAASGVIPIVIEPVNRDRSTLNSERNDSALAWETVMIHEVLVGGRAWHVPLKPSRRP